MSNVSPARFIPLVFFLSFLSMGLTGVDYFELFDDSELIVQILIITPAAAALSALLYYLVYVKWD